MFITFKIKFPRVMAYRSTAMMWRITTGISIVSPRSFALPTTKAIFSAGEPAENIAFVVGNAKLLGETIDIPVVIRHIIAVLRYAITLGNLILNVMNIRRQIGKSYGG